jgi:flagellar hook-basal body complex protein FliE
MDAQQIAAIQAVGQAQPLAAAASVDPQALAAAGSAPVAFTDMVTQGLQQVNTQINASQTALQSLALGDAQNLHQVMIGLEESRLSFQLFMQVRNRMLEAYQDIMKMQV